MQSADDPKIYLAIFMYNCEKQIPRVIAELDQNLLARFHKILVIDNQSQDKSYLAAQESIAQKNSDKFQLIKNPTNLGLGGSHKVAFEKANDEGAQYLAILHGDHQARAQELHKLLDVAKSHPQAMAVLGSRFMLQSKRSGYSVIRTLGNFALNLVYSVLSFRLTKDLGSGINVFKVISPDRLKNCSDGFTFNMDLLLNYYSNGDQVIFMPISWFEEDQVSNAKTFKVGWTALKTVFKWRISRF